jgi:hypothetical protein
MILIPVVLAALLQGVPGHRYVFRATFDHGDRVVGTVREDGRTARIDLESGRAGDDEYLLIAGGQLLAVHPEDREYSVVDDSTFERIVGVGLEAAADIGVVRFRVRDAQFIPERLGAGDAVAGYATQHVRLTEDYTVEVSAFGVRGDAIHARVVTDYWMTAEPVLVHNPLIEMLSRLGTALGQSDPAFVRRHSASRRALLTGTPLKIVVTAWSSAPDEDDDRPSVQTMEITELTRSSVDPAIFRIPPGFTRRDGEWSWRF